MPSRRSPGDRSLASERYSRSRGNISHIAAENPLAARRGARTLVLSADSLELSPRRGRKGQEEGTRELLAITPYIIVYQIEADSVAILRVWHGAQLS